MSSAVPMTTNSAAAMNTSRLALDAAMRSSGRSSQRPPPATTASTATIFATVAASQPWETASPAPSSGMIASNGIAARS